MSFYFYFNSTVRFTHIRCILSEYDLIPGTGSRSYSDYHMCNILKHKTITTRQHTVFPSTTKTLNREWKGCIGVRYQTVSRMKRQGLWKASFPLLWHESLRQCFTSLVYRIISIKFQLKNLKMKSDFNNNDMTKMWQARNIFGEIIRNVKTKIVCKKPNLFFDKCKYLICVLVFLF